MVTTTARVFEDAIGIHPLQSRQSDNPDART